MTMKDLILDYEAKVRIVNNILKSDRYETNSDFYKRCVVRHECYKIFLREHYEVLNHGTSK